MRGKEAGEEAEKYYRRYGRHAVATLISGVVFGLTGAAVLLDPQLDLNSEIVGWLLVGAGVGGLAVSTYLWVKRHQEKGLIDKRKGEALLFSLAPLQGGAAGQLILRF